LGRGLVAAWLAAFAVVAAAEPVTLERDSVLRAEPRSGSAEVARLATGATGTAVARQGAWVKVESGSNTGWLYSFNVRFGAAAGASGDGAGAGSVLGRVFGPRQRINVTATIGIRGLGEEDLKQARFDAGQLQQLDGFAATREQAEAHAGEAGLSAGPVEYLAQPAPAAPGEEPGGNL